MGGSARRGLRRDAAATLCYDAVKCGRAVPALATHGWIGLSWPAARRRSHTFVVPPSRIRGMAEPSRLWLRMRWIGRSWSAARRRSHIFVVPPSRLWLRSEEGEWAGPGGPRRAQSPRGDLKNKLTFDCSNPCPIGHGFEQSKVKSNWVSRLIGSSVSFALASRRPMPEALRASRGRGTGGDGGPPGGWEEPGGWMETPSVRD